MPHGPSTYIYPVRSLLTGIHTPVSPNATPNYFDNRFTLSDTTVHINVHSDEPNVSHFPAETSEQQSGPCVADPGECLSHLPVMERGREVNPLHPEPISAAGVVAFADGKYTDFDSESTRTHSNFAAAGLVHLAPVRPDSQPTSPSLSSAVLPSTSVRASTEGSNSQAGVRSSNKGLDSQEPIVTFRFQHVELGDQGHHVVVGREGKLEKCEDEPITVPGAVQGFGVLLALNVDETDNLVVRQVSENATELLGLSPQYLFSLDCFTQTLSDEQADILWDNVQFLNDPEFDEPDHPHEGPQVFLLSGWGEPDSATFQSDARRQGRHQDRRSWNCWCAAHRSPSALIILEFELERDIYNPLYPPHQADPGLRGSSRGSDSAGSNSTDPGLSKSGSGRSGGLSSSTPAHVDNQRKVNRVELDAMSQQAQHGDDPWLPSAEDIVDSTTNHARPLRALERMRRVKRDQETVRLAARGGRGYRRRGSRSSRIGTMDVFSVLAQANDQLATAPDLDSFLKVVVGIIKDLCQFHRVLVYQFDEMWNGQVVAELVDWRQAHDLYKGLHFPASDIPAQARELYRINKVRLLYDRAQTTARLVVRSRRDLDPPLDMTHSYLRAMSPIHVKYLENMGVRASMSISIVAFGALWGLITCHSYGDHGMRVSFPVRQILRLLSDSISRNVERLSYAQRLRTRKLISTLPTGAHPTGYIVSNAEDLVSLFDADFGVLVVGGGAKILGPNQHGQEILILTEYLRLKQFELIQVSQSVTTDFPDLVLPTGLEIIAGLLYVPLSSGGKDFIALLRKGQLRDVHWAGKPFKGTATETTLEPRKSFKMWSETIVGRCRAWTDEQLETAGVLALVYGKFIEVWRQKESVLQTTQLTNILLSNASHEVRTPLNHIINYLELALNGPLDGQTRENLTRSHSASKSLLFTINDLLDLTRLESGNETSFSEPFDLQVAIEEVVHLYRIEATRRELEFRLDVTNSPRLVIGDSKKIRTVLGNLVANAIKYTSEGKITIECYKFPEPPGLRISQQIAVEIVVTDTGCGISQGKLESMFREFEQVESTASKAGGLPGLDKPGPPSWRTADAKKESHLGLGLAVVARIIEQLGGQLRVDSKPNGGSRFSFLIPFSLYDPSSLPASNGASSTSPRSVSSQLTSERSTASEMDSFVEAVSEKSENHMSHPSKTIRARTLQPTDGIFPVEGSEHPVRNVVVEGFDRDQSHPKPVEAAIGPAEPQSNGGLQPAPGKLRVLVVDDDVINRTVLSKRLILDGHQVTGSTNGREGVETVELDRAFDCVLMDIQMPILDGFEATKRIRSIEEASSGSVHEGPIQISLKLNGRIPIFAVSASLAEHQREDMSKLGLDGWILKPIDFKRLGEILRGITDVSERRSSLYHPGCNWESGGWFTEPCIHV